MSNGPTSSEHNQSEESAQDSYAWTWGVIESAVDGIFAIDSSGLIEYINPSAQAMFNYTPDDVCGKNVSMLMPTPYSTEHDDYLSNYLNTKVAKVIGIGREVAGKRKDGSIFPIHLSVSEVKLEDRTLFTGVIHDISDQKAAQLEKDKLLQELNWRNKELNCLYRIGELVRSGVFNDEQQQIIVHVLDATLGEANVAGMCLQIDDSVCASQLFQKTPWSVSVDIIVEGRIRGNLVIFYVSAREDESDNWVVEETNSLLDEIARLIGEAIGHKEADSKVLHASKLASIGELAAGLGHEINNPVNGIINCADILLKGCEPGSKTEEFTALIRSEAERIAVIVRDLLTFSRQDVEQFSLARMVDIVDSVLTLCSKKLEKSHIHLMVHVSDDLPKIKCRSEQLQQVLMNLIINAMHALDEKYPEHHAEKKMILEAQTHDIKDVPHMRLTVKDWGTGIAPAHLERIYDPFFTTKGRDTGTGLGLSVSDGIIKNHNGIITLDSRQGEYTVFHVDIPLDYEPLTPRISLDMEND